MEKEKIEQQRTNELQFSGTKARKMPNFNKVEAPVKLTAAAVKREALALKKAAEKEEKRLKDLEWNQRDETEFVTWKKEMDERENVLRLEQIQRKKIEMELCREEAIIAQQRKVHENVQNAMEMKIESHKRMDQREEEAKELFDQKLQIVDQVHSQKDKANEAIEEKKHQNREVRDQISKDLSDAI